MQRVRRAALLEVWMNLVALVLFWLGIACIVCAVPLDAARRGAHATSREWLFALLLHASPADTIPGALVVVVYTAARGAWLGSTEGVVGALCTGAVYLHARSRGLVRLLRVGPAAAAPHAAAWPMLDWLLSFLFEHLFDVAYFAQRTISLLPLLVDSLGDTDMQFRMLARALAEVVGLSVLLHHERGAREELLHALNARLRARALLGDHLLVQ